MPVSGHVFRLDFVPVSFSSFPFLREGIILLRSRQDGVAGTVTNNQYNYLPYGVYLSNLIAKEIDTYRKSVDYLLPDGKVQVTISENNLEQLIINVQHKENIHPDFIENEIKQKVLTQLIDCIHVDIQINRKSNIVKNDF